MNQKTIGVVIIAVIALAIFNLVAFIFPFAHTATFWFSYGFVLVAFALTTVSIYGAFIKKPDAKSRYYGFPIARLGIIYGAAQLIVSLVVMALGAFIPWWSALAVYAIGLGIATIGLVGTSVVVDEIQTQDVKAKKDTGLMRNLHSKVNQIASQTDDAAIKALAEEIRYSDPVSNESIADAEADLAVAVDELRAAFVEDDKEAMAQLCRKASALLNERNRLCKLNKK